MQTLAEAQGPVYGQVRGGSSSSSRKGRHGGYPDPPALSVQEQEALNIRWAELDSMKQSSLRKAGRAAGIRQEVLDSLEDNLDPKTAIMKLIMTAETAHLRRVKPTSWRSPDGNWVHRSGVGVYEQDVNSKHRQLPKVLQSRLGRPSKNMSRSTPNLRQVGTPTLPDLHPPASKPYFRPGRGAEEELSGRLKSLHAIFLEAGKNNAPQVYMSDRIHELAKPRVKQLPPALDFKEASSPEGLVKKKRHGAPYIPMSPKERKKLLSESEPALQRVDTMEELEKRLDRIMQHDSTAVSEPPQAEKTIPKKSESKLTKASSSASLKKTKSGEAASKIDTVPTVETKGLLVENTRQEETQDAKKEEQLATTINAGEQEEAEKPWEKDGVSNAGESVDNNADAVESPKSPARASNESDRRSRSRSSERSYASDEESASSRGSSASRSDVSRKDERKDSIKSRESKKSGESDNYSDDFNESQGSFSRTVSTRSVPNLERGLSAPNLEQVKEKDDEEVDVEVKLRDSESNQNLEKEASAPNHGQAEERGDEKEGDAEAEFRHTQSKNELSPNLDERDAAQNRENMEKKEEGESAQNFDEMDVKEQGQKAGQLDSALAESQEDERKPTSTTESPAVGIALPKSPEQSPSGSLDEYKDEFETTQSSFGIANVVKPEESQSASPAVKDDFETTQSSIGTANVVKPSLEKSEPEESQSDSPAVKDRPETVEAIEENPDFSLQAKVTEVEATEENQGLPTNAEEKKEATEEHPDLSLPTQVEKTVEATEENPDFSLSTKVEKTAEATEVNPDSSLPTKDEDEEEIQAKQNAAAVRIQSAVDTSKDVAVKVQEDDKETKAKQNAAAVRIQSVHRGKVGRAQVREKKKNVEQAVDTSKDVAVSVQEDDEETKAKQNAAAVRIQSVHRGSVGRAQVREKQKNDEQAVDTSKDVAVKVQEDDEEQAKQNAAAIRIQSVHRGKVGREQVREKKKKKKKKKDAEQALEKKKDAEQAQDQKKDDEEAEAKQNAAAIRIQSVHRGKVGREQARQKKNDAEQARDKKKDEEIQSKQNADDDEIQAKQNAAATRIQSVHRGKVGRKQVREKKKDAAFNGASDPHVGIEVVGKMDYDDDDDFEATQSSVATPSLGTPQQISTTLKGIDDEDEFEASQTPTQTAAASKAVPNAALADNVLAEKLDEDDFEDTFENSKVMEDDQSEELEIERGSSK